MEIGQTEKRTTLDVKLITALVFLVPLLVIPSGLFPFQFSKTFLTLIFTVLTLLVFLINSLKTKTVNLTWSYLSLSLFLLVIGYFFAALFSSELVVSFFGYQLEKDTFGFVLLMAALTFTITTVIKNRGKVATTLTAFLFASWIVFLFQLIQVLFSAPFPGVFFANPSNNLIGQWNDFALFSGLIGSLSLLAFEKLSLSKTQYALLAGTFAISMFFLIITNMAVAWILFGFVSLGMLVFTLAKRYLKNQTEKTQAPFSGVLPFIGVLVALFFLFFGAGTSAAIQNALNISVIEVRPSFQGTLQVLGESYQENPVFGSGPNTFDSAWFLHRPAQIVQTPFWNIGFTSGFGFLPSTFVTGGIVVGLLWILFLLVSLFTLFRASIVAGEATGRLHTATLVSALGVFYLSVAHIFYSPSQTLTILWFIFTGLLLASLRGTKLVRKFSFQLQTLRVGVVFIFIGILIAFISIGALYGGLRTYAGSVYHNHAISEANQGNLEGAVVSVNRALSLHKQDRHFRTAALIDLARVNRVVGSGATDTEAQEVFRATLASAIENTGRAIEYNPQKFANWMTRSLVYASVVPLGIDGAYENALQTFEEARLKNPQDPEVHLRLAEINLAEGNIEMAREALTTSLQKKPDYTPAILLRAQLELNDGNLGDAIEAVRAAVFFEPQNEVLLYQLGILLLQNESYEDAALAFESALAQNRDFANASFFLSQAYAFLGQFDDAVILMNRLAAENPDNNLVQEYRTRLSQNENPFEQAPVPPATEEEIIVE